MELHCRLLIPSAHPGTATSASLAGACPYMSLFLVQETTGGTSPPSSQMSNCLQGGWWYCACRFPFNMERRPRGSCPSREQFFNTCNTFYIRPSPTNRDPLERESRSSAGHDDRDEGDVRSGISGVWRHHQWLPTSVRCVACRIPFHHSSSTIDTNDTGDCSLLVKV